jgi:hypothetical protein
VNKKPVVQRIANAFPKLLQSPSDIGMLLKENESEARQRREAMGGTGRPGKISDMFSAKIPHRKTRSDLDGKAVP